MNLGSRFTDEKLYAIYKIKYLKRALNLSVAEAELSILKGT